MRQVSDEKKLSEKIKEIQKEKFDVVILTVNHWMEKVHRIMRMTIMIITATE